MRYAFADMVIDTDRCEVLRGQAPLSLRPKAYDLLRHLAGRPGQVASKDELLSAVWPDVEVTEDSLTQCVAELRRSLGNVGTALIRTVPRKGYMLDCEVTKVEQRQTARSWPLRPPFAIALMTGLAAALSIGFVALRSNELPDTRFIPRHLTHSVLGQPVVYPDGKAMMISGVKYLPVGFTSEFHTHDNPLVVYVLRGRIAIDYGERGVREFGPGDTFIEAVGWPHSAANIGWRRAEVLVVEISSDR